MKAPDRIYVCATHPAPFWFSDKQIPNMIEYVRKDALLEWANAELERLWELVPDSDKVENETATPMEIRYLGQYMQMESVIDKLNSL